MDEIKCDERLCAVCGHDCGHSHRAKEIERRPVSVEDMAERREARAARQAELIKEHGLPVVSFTMNIAGPYKYSSAAEICFNLGVEQLLQTLARFNSRPVHEEYHIDFTGCEALFCFPGLNARMIKAQAQKIEEDYGYGRLFDIDVIDKNGVKLERAKPRECLICSKPAAECARNRTHTLEELRIRTNELLREATAHAASTAACTALMYEVDTTPKAGLVDLNNNGANSDMDPGLFRASAEALAPYFYSMAYIAADADSPESGHGEGCGEDDSVNCADCPSHDSCGLEHGASLMTKLTILGVEAETVMKKATGGVNTHKGAIFCLGLLVSAFAKLIAAEKSCGVPDILAEAKRLAALRPDPGRGTNGAEAREKYSEYASGEVFGADAEARAGFPAAAEAYRRILGFRLMGFDDNDCFALALIGVMAELFDTNAYKRGGREGAEFVRKRAKEIASMPLSKRLDEVLVFDRELIERNINCGGAADMLAAAIFLDKLGAYADRRTDHIKD
ncbi:MAG: citrate lyase holo-[acyl-carrier protein] synthase [Clostridia bacterium]|nr:citrate lyase holo-[acyl-carrier protein] synthase [Clostridia bacterium]